MKSPVLECTHVTKTYNIGKNKIEVLRDLSLKIYPGSFNIIYGPSGCGKSTLLALLAGLDTPTSGELLVRDQPLNELTTNQLARYRNKKVGMVFQSFNLIQSLNVWENISLPYVFLGYSLTARKKRALKLLSIVDMAGFADRYPNQLSGGQQQRVAIVRSLMNNPWILLVDEPTGNLDSEAASEVMHFLKELNEKSHRTIIMVTHNHEYLKYGSKIIYMKDGKVTRTEEKRTSHISDHSGDLSEGALEKI